MVVINFALFSHVTLSYVQSVFTQKQRDFWVLLKVNEGSLIAAFLGCYIMKSCQRTVSGLGSLKFYQGPSPTFWEFSRILSVLKALTYPVHTCKGVTFSVRLGMKEEMLWKESCLSTEELILIRKHSWLWKIHPHVDVCLQFICSCLFAVVPSLILSYLHV